MRKHGRLFSFIVIWFGSTMLFYILALFLYPTGDDNTLMISDAYLVFMVVAPIMCGLLLPSGKRLKKKKIELVDEDGSIIDDIKQDESEANSSKINIPFSKKKREELAASLLDDINLNVAVANKSTSLEMFTTAYDEALTDIEKLMQLEGRVKFKGESPALGYYRLKEELQWHMCDAIERAKDRTIDEIKEKYRNSKEFQKKAYSRFELDIEQHRHRFSEETSDFADEAIREVRRAIGQFGDEYIFDVPASAAQTDIAIADSMEGHEFEFFCADLLKKNGFSNVQVTPGSGDQGVDVLAEKDGVKYAVQCKCYSSDLGNGPIQEVNAGKAVYHCHIGVVMTNRHFTAGAKQAADATGTLLWDREMLASMLQASTG